MAKTEQEFRVLKSGTCPSLSGRSKLTYDIACGSENELHVRVLKNSGGEPAQGIVVLQVTAPFTAADGSLITMAASVGQIVDGRLLAKDASALSVPVTPTGIAVRNAVVSAFITTSPTQVSGDSRLTSNGRGSPGFMPRGVPFTTRSKPTGSREPVCTTSRG